MGMMKSIEIELLNFKEEDFQEIDFIKSQKIKREYYIKKFQNEELDQKGRVQLKLFF